jgi:hypothetical protein
MLLEHSPTPPDAPLAAPPSTDALAAVRRLLLSGSCTAACAAAMDGGLWDHAFAIASRLGKDAFLDVLARCGVGAWN